MNTVRKYRALFTALLLLLVALVFPVHAFAVSNPLDEIQEYTIQVDMRNDGTMDITWIGKFWMIRRMDRCPGLRLVFPIKMWMKSKP